MPISGCHDLPLATFNLPSRNRPQTNAKESPSDTGATSKEKNNIVIPEFSAWLTLVLEQCRAENIRNLPRQRAPTPLFPERRPREACSMPISGCHDLPLATFNLPSRNRPQTNAKESPSDTGATSKEKNNIVIPEFSAWLTLVLEQCRAENIRNLPRQRAPTPLFPERRPREACSMPISGCHDLPLATFNLPSRNRPQTNAKESPSDTGATSKEKNNIVIPEFSAWLTLVLEQCRAENIRNLPRQRAPTPLFPERRPREACSMPISGCHDLPLATFNLPSRNRPQTNAKESPKPKTSSPAPPHGGVPSTLWRHACLTTPVVKPSPPQQALKTNGNNAPPQKQKPLVPSLCGGMRV